MARSESMVLRPRAEYIKIFVRTVLLVMSGAKRSPYFVPMDGAPDARGPRGRGHRFPRAAGHQPGRSRATGGRPAGRAPGARSVWGGWVAFPRRPGGLRAAA